MKAIFAFRPLPLLAGVVLLTAWNSPVRAADKEPPPPIFKGTTPIPPAAIPDAESFVVAPISPPAAQSKFSAADLERLAAPIALYPDPLIATILPAAVYPFEIVLAARFVADTNNLAKLDGQPWDASVKGVARIPAVIQKMNSDLAWTIDLGQAFVGQQKELMDTIQTLRFKAQDGGSLKTTQQQNVVVTNAVVERTFQQQVVYVTNTVLQIQPSNPEVIYVPQYAPSVVYGPPPAYVDPLVPLLTFGAAVAVGAIIANNCDWNYGGVWFGGGGVYFAGGGGYYPPYCPPPPGCYPPPYYPPPGQPPPSTKPPPGYPPQGGNPPANQPPTVAPMPARRPSASTVPAAQATGKRWQPDSSRVKGAGAPASVATAQSRGWTSSATRVKSTSGPAVVRPATPYASFIQPSSSPNSSIARPPGTPSSVSRPSPPPAYSKPSPSSGSGPAVQRPSSTPKSGSSAFRGMSSGASARNSSQRGSSSRGSMVNASSSVGGKR